MTSLVDVIFLLLLFFMLSSTFARHGELELPLAGGGASDLMSAPPVFVQLLPDTVRLNGQEVALEALPAGIEALASATAPGGRIVLGLARDVSAQRLADLLVLLRGLGGWQLHILG